MITIQKEKILAAAEEMESLLQSHFDEVALHKDEIPLDPDWPRYVALEEHGICHLITARIDGKLIGYSVVFLSTHMQHASTMVADCDALYIHPAYRHGSKAGIRIIEYTEKFVKSLGAKKMVWHIKNAHDWSLVLYRKGYEDEEKIVGKIL